MNLRNFVNTRYCVVHVAIITFWFKIIQVLLCQIYTHIKIRTHTHSHTQTHTHTHTHTHTRMQARTDAHPKSSFLMKTKTEWNKLKYLHYLNKMIEKCKIKKLIFSDVSCFYPELFERFCLDFKWLHSNFGIQWTPFADLRFQKQPLEILVKSWKISYKEFHS